jgi:hypothetical protein
LKGSDPFAFSIAFVMTRNPAAKRVFTRKDNRLLNAFSVFDGDVREDCDEWVRRFQRIDCYVEWPVPTADDGSMLQGWELSKARTRAMKGLFRSRLGWYPRWVWDHIPKFDPTTGEKRYFDEKLEEFRHHFREARRDRLPETNLRRIQIQGEDMNEYRQALTEDYAQRGLAVDTGEFVREFMKGLLPELCLRFRGDMVELDQVDANSWEDVFDRIGRREADSDFVQIKRDVYDASLPYRDHWRGHFEKDELEWLYSRLPAARSVIDVVDSVLYMLDGRRKELNPEPTEDEEFLDMPDIMGEDEEYHVNVIISQEERSAPDVVLRGAVEQMRRLQKEIDERSNPGLLAKVFPAKAKREANRGESRAQRVTRTNTPDEEDPDFVLDPLYEAHETDGPTVMETRPGDSKTPVMVIARAWGAPVISCLDGGSSITLVSQRLFEAASKVEPVTLMKWKGVVKDAQKKPIGILGKTQLLLEFPDTKWRVYAGVARDLSYDVIIGNDVLDTIGVRICYDTHTVEHA